MSSLEPVGGSAPKFSSGAIEQLKIEASTAATLLCAAQAAPSPAFRSTAHLFVQFVILVCAAAAWQIVASCIFAQAVASTGAEFAGEA